ncbi:unnamed protein product [Rhizoctonia solani]|uniref:Ca3427-like PBP 2 domain-containing protein n=1 Tax=Rhizoctonia solani TaxID=456999 RepID=A0A8H3G6E0_9AGAM|nr:unnamed protein product [Rhizoctonia solani]
MLRVGYVPEHFASPLLKASGTGAMAAALQNNEIDVAVALTDALIAGIANGSQAYKLVGSYVSTPLNWAVVTGKDSKYQSIDDLRGTKLGISRVGSGSQTMASVMAMQKNWVDKDGQVEMPEFQVNNNLRGLNTSINDGTTRPCILVGMIGSVLTPWPSWLIAAHPSPERAEPTALRNFLGNLTEYVVKFDSKEQRAQAGVTFIREKFGYPEADVRAWLDTVRWVEDCTAIPGKVIVDTLNILDKAGVVKRPPQGFKAEDFINSEVVRLV